MNAQLDQERDATLRNSLYKPVNDSHEEKIAKVQAILDDLDQRKSEHQGKITALAQQRDASEKALLE